MRINTEEIKAVLTNEVIKRDVMEGEKADEARRKISRSAKKSLRSTSKDENEKSDTKDCAVNTESVEAAKD